jgi:YfiH family protein
VTIHPPHLSHPGLAVRHGFFSRLGGVSTGAYASLNGSLSGGDDPAAVGENRGRVAAALDRPAAHLLGLSQVHSAEVVCVTEPWPIGAGPRADAMVTARAELGLVIITADCAPVLFADPAAGVIGAAHAGWRGALAGVLEATLVAMRELGAAHITAVIGPCIGAGSYQVGANLRDAVLAGGTADARFFTDDPVDSGADRRWRFDLASYCAARLHVCGATVHLLAADTFAAPERFFSHRRRTLAGGGPIGHQMSAIAL